MQAGEPEGSAAQRTDAPPSSGSPPESVEARADGLSAHILPTSATMIGVCLTALYVSLLRPAGAGRLLVDKLLAVDALVFLASAALSFVSMRAPRRGRRMEARDEAIFLAGLALLALVAVALAFAVD